MLYPTRPTHGPINRPYPGPIPGMCLMSRLGLSWCLQVPSPGGADGQALSDKPCSDAPGPLPLCSTLTQRIFCWQQLFFEGSYLFIIVLEVGVKACVTGGLQRWPLWEEARDCAVPDKASSNGNTARHSKVHQPSWWLPWENTFKEV